MWYFVLLGSALIVVIVVAVVTERRRRGLGGDSRDDRFVNPHTYQSWTDKESGHGGLNG